MVLNLMKSHSFQSHPYHLVQPSPWPLLMSLSLLVLTVSAVMYMHGIPNGDNLLSLGFMLTLGCMSLWFKDIIIESTYQGDHTDQVKRGLIIGISLFIISELMAFVSIFWAFFHSSLSPAVEIGGTWPPFGITSLNPLSIPLLNTLLLLSSGAFITLAHHALLKGDRKNALLGTLLTILFAIIFTALQYFEYTEASFTITDSVFGSVFYCSTGLHGIHVMIGTAFIFVQLIRLVNHEITTTHHAGMEASIYYWHFVDVVWLFLFGVVYCWSFIDNG